MEKPIESRVYRTVVIGDGCVGKSALTIQYVSNIFLDFHDPTIEDAYQKQTVIDNNVAVVDILDTAAQDELQTTLKEQCLTHGEGYIGVYSIDDEKSYQNLRKHLLELKRIRNTDRVPIVIVGNKLDLFQDRQVSTMEGVALAREFDCPFYETSAANRINVEDVFNGVIRQIRRASEEIDQSEELNKKPKLKRFKTFMSKKFYGSLTRLPQSL